MPQGFTFGGVSVWFHTPAGERVTAWGVFPGGGDYQKYAGPGKILAGEGTGKVNKSSILRCFSDGERF